VGRWVPSRGGGYWQGGRRVLRVRTHRSCYNPPRLKVTFSVDAKYDPAVASTGVEIFGQTYNVRGDGDPDYLVELARFVDSRMREVAAQVATVDPLKIAVLAALNIADEFTRLKHQRQGAAGIWLERTEEISDRLSKVIS
jgi:cell division protein ZapA